MKKTLIALSTLAAAAIVSAEVVDNDNSKTDKSPVEIKSRVNPAWDFWKARGYFFGFDKNTVPVPVFVDAPLYTNSTIMVRGQNSLGKRWRYHCFEAYADDDTSRITMLVNKHAEEGKDVAEIYYYASKYGHGDQTYNWVKIGSDVRGHSYMFSRDRAIFYGSLELENALTLGNIGKDSLRPDAPKGDDEANYRESAKYSKYKALKRAKDGTIYFDKDKKMVLVKIDGKWNKVAVEPIDDYELTVLAEADNPPPPPAAKNPPTEILMVRAEVPKAERLRYELNQENLAVLTNADESGCTRFDTYINAFDNSDYLTYGEFESENAVKKHNESIHLKTNLKRNAEQSPNTKQTIEQLKISADGGEILRITDIETKQATKLKDAVKSAGKIDNIKLYQNSDIPDNYLLIERIPTNAIPDAKLQTAINKIEGLKSRTKEIRTKKR